MAKLKVQDLPKEEQEKLLAEALEYDVKGLAMATSWNVDTLKQKIEAAKEKAANEQKDESDEQNKADNEQNEPENEQNADSDEQDEKSEEPEEEKEEPKQAEVVQAQSYKICHICRSKVIDGVCSGCGFTF